MATTECRKIKSVVKTKKKGIRGTRRKIELDLSSLNLRVPTNRGGTRLMSCVTALILGEMMSIRSFGGFHLSAFRRLTSRWFGREMSSGSVEYVSLRRSFRYLSIIVPPSPSLLRNTFSSDIFQAHGFAKTP